MRMPRHNYQPQSRMLAGQRLKCVQRQLFFRRLRAARKEHDVVVVEPGQLLQSLR